jgi:filamentous hemagglutinin family protein
MIPRSWLGRSSQFLLLSPLALVWVFRVGIGDLAVAQVSADSSVGTTVTTNGLTYEITEGTTVGDTNLFHSFSSFTIPRGWSADFLNAPTITNILVRVTGDTPSDIQGQLRAQGSANLFLMNPNGIQFGSGARLRIGGSFVGTTASAIGFPGGGEFSITSQVEPQNSLLKVNPSALLFNQIAVQPITNQFAALQVPRGRSLLLLGGNVNLDGGRLQTLDGRVELGGLAGAGMVELEIDSNNLRLSFPQGVQRADVSLTNGAIVSASNTSTGGGNIQVQGKRITLTEGSEIRVNTLGSQPGGTLAVTASELVELTGGSRLLRDTVNTGAAGSLRIETKRLIVQDGSQVSASTLSEGQGGTLAVTASESIELNGTSANGDPSGLFVVAQDIGVAGDIEIETGRLVVRDGAQVSASTLSEGQGGTLTVTASESIELNGTSANGDPSGLFVVAQDIGIAGDIEIETGRLVVRDGAKVSASTLSEGQGGRLTLTASESIQLTGTSANGQSRSGLFVGTTGTGVAGDLKIETGQLTVSDGAVVSARTSSLGNGGNITLQVRDLLQLRGNSQISTAAGIPGAGGNGGNINIDAKLIVAIPGENSDIIANAFEGNGGNINITTQGIFGIQFREELTPLSDINASSEFGVNGIVQINTPDIDPSRGLTNLPTEVVDASNQIDQTCSAGRGEAGKNKFIVTGRRGLPSNPYEMLSNEQALEDIHPPEGFSSRKNSNPDTARSFTSQSATSNPKPPIVEAQGWMINDKGQVVFTATASTSTPHNSWLRSATCPSS